MGLKDTVIWDNKAPQQAQPVQGNSIKADVVWDKPVTHSGIKPMASSVMQNLQLPTGDDRIAAIDIDSDLNDGEKDWLKGHINYLSPEQFRLSHETMAGRTEKQKAGIGEKIKGSYYFDDNGIPVAAGDWERPPDNKPLASLWGTQEEAEDDNPVTGFAKGVWNGFMGIVKTPASVLNLMEGLDMYGTRALNDSIRAKKGLGPSEMLSAPLVDASKDLFENIQFATSSKSDASTIVEDKAFESMSEFFNGDNWNPSWQNMMGLSGQAIGSVLQFMVGGRALGITGRAEVGTTSLANVIKSSAPSIGLSTTIVLADNIEAAEKEGLKGQEKYAVALVNSIGQGILEVAIGGGMERGLLGSPVKAGVQREISTAAVKAFKDAGGEITPQALKAAFKATVNESAKVYPKIAGKFIGGALGEAGEEATQQLWSNSLMALDAKLGGREAKDVFSPEAMKEYFTSALGGFLGGVGGSSMNLVNGTLKDEVQGKGIYKAVAQGKVLELRNGLDTLVKQGKMTPEQRELADFRIDSYERYNGETRDLPLDNEQKESIFNLTWNDENVQKQIADLEADTEMTPALKQAKIKVLKERSNSYIGEIAGIIKKVQPEEQKPEEVKPAEKKAQEKQAEVIAQKPIDQIRAVAAKVAYKNGPETQEEFDLNMQYPKEVALEVERLRKIREVNTELENGLIADNGNLPAATVAQERIDLINQDVDAQIGKLDEALLGKQKAPQPTPVVEGEPKKKLGKNDSTMLGSVLRSKSGFEHHYIAGETESETFQGKESLKEVGHEGQLNARKAIKPGDVFDVMRTVPEEGKVFRFAGTPFDYDYSLTVHPEGTENVETKANEKGELSTLNNVGSITYNSPNALLINKLLDEGREVKVAVIFVGKRGAAVYRVISKPSGGQNAAVKTEATVTPVEPTKQPEATPAAPKEAPKTTAQLYSDENAKYNELNERTRKMKIIKSSETVSFKDALIKFFVDGGKMHPDDWVRILGYPVMSPNRGKGKKEVYSEEYKTVKWFLSDKAAPADDLITMLNATSESVRGDEEGDTALWYGNPYDAIAAFEAVVGSMTTRDEAIAELLKMHEDSSGSNYNTAPEGYEETLANLPDEDQDRIDKEAEDAADEFLAEPIIVMFGGFPYTIDPTKEDFGLSDDMYPQAKEEIIKKFLNDAKTKKSLEDQSTRIADSSIQTLNSGKNTQEDARSESETTSVDDEVDTFYKNEYEAMPEDISERPSKITLLSEVDLLEKIEATDDIEDLHDLMDAAVRDKLWTSDIGNAFIKRQNAINAGESLVKPKAAKPVKTLEDAAERDVVKGSVLARINKAFLGIGTEIMANAQALREKAIELSGGNIQFSIVGENGVSRMANAAETLADLNVAKQMEADGKSAKEIYFATSWERGADNLWRFEVPDVKLKGQALKDSNSGYASEFESKLSSIIDDNGLFNLYPELKNTKVIFQVKSKNYGGGEYDFNSNTITIYSGPDDKLSILVHEIQHAIQKFEGFNQGTNPGVQSLMRDGLSFKEEGELYNSNPRYRELYIKSESRKLSKKESEEISSIYRAERERVVAGKPSGYEMYLRHSGEVEARNVQARLALTEEQRKEKMISETEDIARDQQIAFKKAINDSKAASPLFHYASSGEILGFTHEGKIYLNGEKITAKTTMEEAGHIWINWAKQNNPELHAAGLKKVKNSKYLSDVESSKFYTDEALKEGPKGSEKYNEYLQEEALSKAIADQGAKFVTQSRQASFKRWISDMWKAVIKSFGIRDLSPESVGALTLEDFARMAAADVFNKAPLDESEASIPEQPIRFSAGATEKQMQIANQLNAIANNFDYDDAAHTYTEKGTGIVYPSVTTIMQSLPEYAYGTKGVRTAASNGKKIHKLAEAVAKGQDARKVAEEVGLDISEEALESLINQVEDVIAKMEDKGHVLSETVLANSDFGVAGMSDITVISEDGKVSIFDFKSSTNSVNIPSYETASGKRVSKKQQHSTQLGMYAMLVASDNQELNIAGSQIDELGVIPITYKVNSAGKITGVVVEKIVPVDYNEARGEANRVFNEFRRTQEKADQEELEDSEELSAEEFGELHDFSVAELKQQLADLRNKPIKIEEKKRLIAEKQAEIYAAENATAQYKRDMEELKKLLPGGLDLDTLSKDQLIRIHNYIIKYDNLRKNKYLDRILFTIGERMAADQTAVTGVKWANNRDISAIDVEMMAPTDTPENHPAVQSATKSVLSQKEGEYKTTVLMEEAVDKLITALLKEKQITFKDKASARISTSKNVPKVFGNLFLPEVKGQWRALKDPYNPADAKTLSKAELDLLKHVTDNMANYKERQSGSSRGWWQGYFPQVNKGFWENYYSNGLLFARAAQINKDLPEDIAGVEIDFRDPNTNKIGKVAYGDAIETLNKYSKKSKMKAASAVIMLQQAKSRAIREAKKTGVTYRETEMQKFALSASGEMISRFQREAHSAISDQSLDVGEAFKQYMGDMIHIDHMQPIMPELTAVRSYYKQLRVNPNMQKYLDLWIDGDILGKHFIGKFGRNVDDAAKFMQAWTYMNVMAFNIKGGLGLNAIVGKFNQFRATGGKEMLVGEKRYWANRKKAKAILKHYSVVNVTAEEVVQNNAHNIFMKLANAPVAAAENWIQAAAFFGQMTEAEWANIDEEGNLIDKSKPIPNTRIVEMKKKTRDLQGKYGHEDKRMYKHSAVYAAGMGFKGWMPDMLKERLGQEYTDLFGTVHKGSYRSLQYILRDVQMMMTDPKNWSNSTDLNIINNKKNIREFMSFAVLFMLFTMASDDKEEKKRGNFAWQAFTQVAGMFNLSSWEFLASQPMPALGTIKNLISAVGSMFSFYESPGKYGNKGDWMFPGKVLQVLPYKKVVTNALDVQEYIDE